MSCLLCGSGNQAEFGGEILIHFRSLDNLDKPSVLGIPQAFRLSGLRLFAVHDPGRRTGSSRKRCSGKRRLNQSPTVSHSGVTLRFEREGRMSFGNLLTNCFPKIMAWTAAHESLPTCA